MPGGRVRKASTVGAERVQGRARAPGHLKGPEPPGLRSQGPVAKPAPRPPLSGVRGCWAGSPGASRRLRGALPTLEKPKCGGWGGPGRRPPLTLASPGQPARGPGQLSPARAQAHHSPTQSRAWRSGQASGNKASARRGEGPKTGGLQSAGRWGRLGPPAAKGPEATGGEGWLGGTHSEGPGLYPPCSRTPQPPPLGSPPQLPLRVAKLCPRALPRRCSALPHRPRGPPPPGLPQPPVRPAAQPARLPAASGRTCRGHAAPNCQPAGPPTRPKVRAVLGALPLLGLSFPISPAWPRQLLSSRPTPGGLPQTHRVSLTVAQGPSPRHTAAPSGRPCHTLPPGSSLRPVAPAPRRRQSQAAARAPQAHEVLCLGLGGVGEGLGKQRCPRPANQRRGGRGVGPATTGSGSARDGHPCSGMPCPSCPPLSFPAAPQTLARPQPTVWAHPVPSPPPRETLTPQRATLKNLPSAPGLEMTGTCVPGPGLPGAQTGPPDQAWAPPWVGGLARGLGQDPLAHEVAHRPEEAEV